jgi:hypothetical protein
VQLEQYKVINTIEALELERDKIYYPLFRVYGVYGAYPNEQSKTILIGQLIGKPKTYPFDLKYTKKSTHISYSYKKNSFHIRSNRIHI